MDTLSELKYYCNTDCPAGALLLTGEWGCGKSYLINKQLIPQLSETHVFLKVSLFGLPDIESVHTRVKKAWLNAKGGLLMRTQDVEKYTGPLKKLVALAFRSDLISDGINGILSINPLDFVEIKCELDGKKVILVFDDLERSNLKTTDILGAINDYCENKSMNVIIVANESKIKNDDEKILYRVIKEKIVQRTVKHKPDYDAVVKNVVVAANCGNHAYQDFLLAHLPELQALFAGVSLDGIALEEDEDAKAVPIYIHDERERRKEQERIEELLASRSHNIRSLKAAIQDFERLYVLLSDKHIEDLEKWLFSFVSATIANKADSFNPDKEYGFVFTNSDMARLFPGFYSSSYMPRCISMWITDGIWDEVEISSYLDDLVHKQSYKNSPVDLVRTWRFDYLSVETIREGFSPVLKKAYGGNLSLEDYVNLITNSYLSRFYGFTLPEEIDWQQVRSGIEKKKQWLIINRDKDGLCRQTLDQSIIDNLTVEERKSYEMILGKENVEELLFQRNIQQFLELMKKDPDEAVRICKTRRFNCFTKEMAVVTADAFARLSNYGKAFFIESFPELLSSIFYSMDYSRNGDKDKSDGFAALKEMLTPLLEQYTDDPFSRKRTERLICIVEDLIEKPSTAQLTKE